MQNRSLLLLEKSTGDVRVLRTETVRDEYGAVGTVAALGAGSLCSTTYSTVPTVAVTAVSYRLFQASQTL